jgi:hypothetical protein
MVDLVGRFHIWVNFMMEFYPALSTSASTDMSYVIYTRSWSGWSVLFCSNVFVLSIVDLLSQGTCQKLFTKNYRPGSNREFFEDVVRDNSRRIHVHNYMVCIFLHSHILVIVFNKCFTILTFCSFLLIAPVL